VDLLFCTNDITCLRMGAGLALKAAADAVEQAASERIAAGNNERG
jgi:hypothetical protein